MRDHVPFAKQAPDQRAAGRAGVVLGEVERRLDVVVREDFQDGLGGPRRRAVVERQRHHAPAVATRRHGADRTVRTRRLSSTWSLMLVLLALWLDSRRRRCRWTQGPRIAMGRRRSAPGTLRLRCRQRPVRHDETRGDRVPVNSIRHRCTRRCRNRDRTGLTSRAAPNKRQPPRRRPVLARIAIWGCNATTTTRSGRSGATRVSRSERRAPATERAYPRAALPGPAPCIAERCPAPPVIPRRLRALLGDGDAEHDDEKQTDASAHLLEWRRRCPQQGYTGTDRLQSVSPEIFFSNVRFASARCHRVKYMSG